MTFDEVLNKYCTRINNDKYRLETHCGAFTLQKENDSVVLGLYADMFFFYTAEKLDAFLFSIT